MQIACSDVHIDLENIQRNHGAKQLCSSWSLQSQRKVELREARARICRERSVSIQAVAKVAIFRPQSVKLCIMRFLSFHLDTYSHSSKLSIAMEFVFLCEKHHIIPKRWLASKKETIPFYSNCRCFKFCVSCFKKGGNSSLWVASYYALKVVIHLCGNYLPLSSVACLILKKQPTGTKVTNYFAIAHIERVPQKLQQRSIF